MLSLQGDKSVEERSYRPDISQCKLGDEQVDEPKPANPQRPIRAAPGPETYVHHRNSERNCSGDFRPRAKSLNTVTNLPKIKSINGSSTPPATAQVKAMPFKVHPTVSVYEKTRYALSEIFAVRSPKKMPTK